MNLKRPVHAIAGQHVDAQVQPPVQGHFHLSGRANQERPSGVTGADFADQRILGAVDYRVRLHHIHPGAGRAFGANLPRRSHQLQVASGGEFQNVTRLDVEQRIGELLIASDIKVATIGIRFRGGTG